MIDQDAVLGRVITTAIVDDHQVLVDTLRVVIGNEPDMKVVGNADSCASCLDLVHQMHPQVLLLDVHLPDGDGLSLIPKVNRISPGTNILVLTSLADEVTLMKAMDMGVTGFVGKNQHLKELIAAIRQAANGEIAIPASLLLGLLNRKMVTRNVTPTESRQENLTPRELAVLNCLASGLSSQEIAGKLSISPLTVQTHIRNIITKFGVHSRLEAVTHALQAGLIEPPM
jgi:DNA-binding NarL/FixJ family response regulator